jgi:hypothetical protein
MDWKVTSEAKIDFKEPGFNDDKWRNAVMVEKVVVPAPVKSDTLKSLNPNPQDPEDFSAEPDTNQPTVEGNIIVIPADTAQGTMENTGIISAEDIVEVDSSALVVERAEADTVPPAASVADTSQKTVSLVAAQYTIVSQIGETAPVPAPEVKGPDMSALEALGVKPIWSDEAKEKLYFRYTFNISGIPVSGIVTISADDKYVLYVNGQFVGEGSEEVMSWLKPTTYTVKSFLAPRKNVVAVETSDPDLTANGLWFKMDYNTMPENIDELPIVRGVK